MNLHENTDDFKNAITATAQNLGLRELFIEKDYWVTFILNKISTSVYKDNLVFKGGTSLSKAYKIIERFSEDIDLALIIPEEQNNDNKRKRYLSDLAKNITKGFTEDTIEGITSKKGKFRKTAHIYPKVIEDNSASIVKDRIIVELNSFTKPFPNQNIEISCMIAEFLNENKQQHLIEQYYLQAFPIKVLTIERTFVEKLFSIIRHSYSLNAIDELKDKIRHIYDLKLLLSQDRVSNLVNSNDLLAMIKIVKEDDIGNEQFKGDWVDEKWSESILFSQTDDTWDKLNVSYNTGFKELVYGTFPPPEEIKKTIIIIGDRLKELGL